MYNKFMIEKLQDNPYFQHSNPEGQRLLVDLITISRLTKTFEESKNDISRKGWEYAEATGNLVLGSETRIKKVNSNRLSPEAIQIAVDSAELLRGQSALEYEIGQLHSGLEQYDGGLITVSTGDLAQPGNISEHRLISGGFTRYVAFKGKASGRLRGYEETFYNGGRLELFREPTAFERTWRGAREVTYYANVINKLLMPRLVVNVV